MAQTHQLLTFEPWLKPPKNGHLTCRFSHGLFLIHHEFSEMQKQILGFSQCFVGDLEGVG